MNMNDKTHFVDGPMEGKFLRSHYVDGVQFIDGDFPGRYEHVHAMQWSDENRDYRVVRELRYRAAAE
ncbi:MAG: hypothetical protein ACREO4_06215 [Lysobacter sp.]